MDYSPYPQSALKPSALCVSLFALAGFAPSSWAVIASDDSRASLIDTTRIINVLVNDQSPNIDAPTTRVCIAGQTDACPGLQETLVAPANGTISVAPDGRSIVYRPNTGFTGTDEFTYAVYAPEDADANLPILDTARVQVQILSASGREEVGQNVRNFETIFGIFCDPSISSQIADESTRLQVQAQCEAFQNLTLEEQAQALISLTPKQISATYSAALTSGKDQQRNISLRLNELRNGSQGISLNNLNFFNQDQQFQGIWLTELAQLIGGGASADSAEESPFGRLGVFINGTITQGERDNTDLERRYDLDASNITLGMDYRFSDRLIGGLALGYSDTDLAFVQATDKMATGSTSVLMYGTWQHDLFYVDALAGVAFGDVKTQRGISIGDSLDTLAKGSTDSKQASLSLSINHDYAYQALTLSPFASLDYTHGVVDGYQEKNGAGFGVVFSDQEIKSQLITLGVRGQYAWAQTWGILIPHARLEYKKELETERDLITGRFIADPTGNQFFIEADEVDGTWGQFAVGIAAILPHGLSGYVEYDRVMGLQHTTLASFSIGGRWEATF